MTAASPQQHRPGAAPTTTSVAPTFEQQRLARIQRNRQMLVDLGLEELPQQLLSKGRQRKQGGAKRKRHHKADDGEQQEQEQQQQEPARKSRRLQQQQPEEQQGAAAHGW
jgi:hypothetical protein